MCILFHADAVGTDGTLYHLQASMEAAQYESLGRADDALLVKMLDAGLVKLKAGNHCAFQYLRHTKLSTQIATGVRIAVDNGLQSSSTSRCLGKKIPIMGFDEWHVCHTAQWSVEREISSEMRWWAEAPRQRSISSSCPAAKPWLSNGAS